MLSETMNDLIEKYDLPSDNIEFHWEDDRDGLILCVDEYGVYHVLTHAQYEFEVGCCNLAMIRTLLP